MLNKALARILAEGKNRDSAKPDSSRQAVIARHLYLKPRRDAPQTESRRPGRERRTIDRPFFSALSIGLAGVCGRETGRAAAR